MTRKSSLLALVAAALVLALVGASTVAAQKPSDLAGKWVFDKSQSTSAPTVPRIFNTTGAPAGSNELVIAQNPKAVTIKIGGVDLIYRLDGTEGNISANGRAGFPVGKAAWDAGKLVATLTQEVFSAAKGNYVKVPLKEVYSVSGRVLTIERTVTHLDGKTENQKLVYTKS
jgi:hypothetical protein